MLSEAAKAWIALLGSVVTGVLGIVTPDDPIYKVLTIVAAVITAVLTYVVPNQPTLGD